MACEEGGGGSGEEEADEAALRGGEEGGQSHAARWVAERRAELRAGTMAAGEERGGSRRSMEAETVRMGAEEAAS